MLDKLDGSRNYCSCLSVMPLPDSRIQLALNLRCDVTKGIFNDCPLFEVPPAARGLRLELLVCAVDKVVNPHADIKLPSPGQQRPRTCDWHRDVIHMECKSSQLQWDKNRRRWLFRFQHVKISSPSSFDELLLAFYTPRGVYIYRHDLRFGLSSAGICTNVTGHHVLVYGPCHEADWVVALDTILNKIGKSDCVRVAFIRW